MKFIVKESNTDIVREGTFVNLSNNGADLRILDAVRIIIIAELIKPDVEWFIEVIKVSGFYAINSLDFGHMTLELQLAK